MKVTSRCNWARVVHALLAAGLLIPTLLPGSLGCSQTRACRAGTLWLSIQLKGASAAVSSLSISVSVDGAAPKTSVLSFPIGQTSGAVEVQFPSGYPANNPAVVSVTAYDGAAPLAEKSMAVTLMPSCSVLELQLDFGAVDAGGGDHDIQDTGGTSATGGRGAGGTGGSAGGAVGGTAGRSSATGGRGTGAGGNPLDAGTDRPCTFRGPEDCYDRIDNDCNGKTDCEDEVCAPIAQCESLDPALGAVGTSIAAGASCPPEAPTTQLLHSGLGAPGCSGCSCATGTATVTCTANLYGYATAAECADPAAPGLLAVTLESTQPCQGPAWPPSPSGSVFGVRADAFQAVLGGTCAPTGAPTKGTPTWTTTTRFCGTSRVGAGCGEGRACVPRTVVASGSCLLMDGAQSCPASLKQTRWSVGYIDGRTCNACSCSPPEGGDCQSTLIAVGNDYSCADAAVHGFLRSDQLRLCISGTTGAYSPGVQFSGAPVAPTCRPTLANMSGALTPTGGQTLCCL